MLQKLLITISVMLFLVVIPVLELNASHVFNPEWPPHARFHNMWQIITNCCLGLLCLWLVWVKSNTLLSGVLVLCIMGGVLAAQTFADFYGGTIVSGNIARAEFGLETATIGALFAVIATCAAIIMHLKEASIQSQKS